MEPNEFRSLYWFSQPGIVMFDAEHEPLSLVVDDRSGALLWTPSMFSVPSPDGGLIASLDWEEEGLVLSVWESRTGAPVGEPRVVDNVDRFLRWTPEGRIQVGSEGQVELLAVEAESTRQAWDGCRWPLTSSSAWNAEGRNAMADPSQNLAGTGRGFRCWDEECPDRRPF